MEKTFKFTLPSPNFNKIGKDACKPKPHFLTPSGMSLLPRERQPPPMYGKLGTTVPPKYLPHHSTGQQLAEEPSVKQYCEPCEMELQSFEDLKRHRAQHEKCPVAGCLYKGHPNVMDKHINALHASGLFDKFKKLSTPEEIAAWREERKKKYPTIANVLLKQKAQEQRKKRGERLEAGKNRFGKVNDRKRAQSNQNEPKKAEGEKVPREGKQQNQRNKRNRKNKRNQKSTEHKERQVKQKVDQSKEESCQTTCGGVKMFRGTGQMKNYQHFNDKKKLPIENALFGLVGMYGSDSMEEEESENDCDNVSEGNDIKSTNFSSISDNIDVDIEANGSSDNRKTCQNNYIINFGENPLENSIQLRNNIQNSFNNNEIANSAVTNQTNEEVEEKSFRTQSQSLTKILPEDSTISCTYKEMTTENLNDDLTAAIDVNSSDEAPTETPIQRSIPDYSIKPEKVLPSQTNEETVAKRCKTADEPLKRKQPLAKRKSGLDYRKGRLRKQNTMLEKLLETDIRHERNVLLQCVRYVCENNYFGVSQRSNHSKPD